MPNTKLEVAVGAIIVGVVGLLTAAYNWYGPRMAFLIFMTVAESVTIVMLILALRESNDA